MLPFAIECLAKLGPMCAASTVPRQCVSSKASSTMPSTARDIEPLHGAMAGAFRLRVWDYRVLFAPANRTMRIFGVRHRSEAYR